MESAKTKRTQAKFVASGEMAKAQARYWRSPKGRANIKRSNAKPSKQIQNRISRLLRDSTLESASLQAQTGFSSNEDVRTHLASTFEPWMTWENHGMLPKGAGRNVVWQIGHRIPCSAYDLSNPEDLKRCFSKANIFAQCAHENISLNDAVPDRDVLEPLRSVWPVSWNYVCDV